MNCELIKKNAPKPLMELKTINGVYSRFVLLKRDKHFNLYPIFKRLNGIIIEKDKVEENARIEAHEYRNLRRIFNYAVKNGAHQISFIKQMFSTYSKIIQCSKNENIPYQFPLQITDGMFKLALDCAEKYENDFGDEIDISAFREAQKTNQLLSQIQTFLNSTSREIQDFLVANKTTQEVVRANYLNIAISCECLDRISLISKRIKLWEIFLRNEEAV